ncbi:MAG TPA: AAA family ATPase, partial [Acidimicrobiales bacterium]|nr:AAA family ATPase [Acidimicrobiales bacterium]
MSAVTVTILVTDLVGSTEQRARLGEDAAEELRRLHDRMMADAVATAKGEVVKGTGDGVLARFGAAADALVAAVSIQQAAAAHTHRHPDRGLAVRVGLSCGDATLENGDCFGTPVIQAARLCAAAQPGQILVAEVVRVLSSGRGDHHFSPVGALELKGLAEPLEVLEVTWSEAASRGALPAGMERSGGFPFAGRYAERQALEAEWKEVLGGAKRVVFLAGEPGIGKTELAAELARAVHSDGATVCFGRCEEDSERPFGPFRSALGQLVMVLPGSALDSHRASFGSEAARLVPAVAEATGEQSSPGGGGAGRDRLFDAVADLVTRAAQEAPVLFVLDDLHWADESSLGLLRHLVRADFGPLLVVGTYRVTDLDRSHPLAAVLADLRREP